MVLDSREPVTQEEIRQMEQELGRLEHDLYEQYCEVGKVILEKAERENRRINCLVDQIIETRRKLAVIEEDNHGTR